MYLSSNDNSYLKISDAFENDKRFEDTDAIFTDVDRDGDLDLFVVSGGVNIMINQSIIKIGCTLTMVMEISL